MDHEEQVSQAGVPAAPAVAGASAVEKLEALGVRGSFGNLPGMARSKAPPSVVVCRAPRWLRWVLVDGL